MAQRVKNLTTGTLVAVEVQVRSPDRHGGLKGSSVTAAVARIQALVQELP